MNLNYLMRKQVASIASAILISIFLIGCEKQKNTDLPQTETENSQGNYSADAEKPPSEKDTEGYDLKKMQSEGNKTNRLSECYVIASLLAKYSPSDRMEKLTDAANIIRNTANVIGEKEGYKENQIEAMMEYWSNKYNIEIINKNPDLQAINLINLESDVCLQFILNDNEIKTEFEQLLMAYATRR